MSYIRVVRETIGKKVQIFSEKMKHSPDQFRIIVRVRILPSFF